MDPDGRSAQPRPDVDGPARVQQGLIEVAGQNGRPGMDNRELTVDRGVWMIDQEALSSLDPPSRGCHESCVQEQGCHLLRRAGPPFVFASTHGRRVNALPGVDGLLRMARQVRGIREGRKCIQVERAGVIGLREEPVGLVPGLPIHGLTGLIEDRVIRRLPHVPLRFLGTS